MTDLQSIQHTLWAYFKALHEGDQAGLRAQFLPAAEVHCRQSGQPCADSLEAYLADLARLPRQPIDFVIQGIDQDGDSAQARISLLRECCHASKALTLRKQQGAWKIARLAIERS